MPKKVLIIDDEEIVTRSFDLLLRKVGYKVSIASNGQDAQKIAGEETLDLIICDIRMPGMNGVETIKAIQSKNRHPESGNIPVIFITGYADEKLEEEAKQLKPLACLYKPFDNAEILQTIRTSLAS